VKLFNTKTEEEKIVDGCRRGDRRWQRKLYDVHSSYMLGVCRRYIGDLHHAEEVLSNGFIKVFDKIDQYKGTGNLRAWIKSIMIRESLNFIRSHHADMYESDEEVLEFLAGEKLFADQVQPEHLIHLIDQLPVGYRTIFNMYTVEGYSHREIAEMLEIEEGTSKSQLSKARKILQKRVIELNYI
jgi:RNA polymerase sigma-70 factor (ECF subfamily)